MIYSPNLRGLPAIAILIALHSFGFAGTPWKAGTARANITPPSPIWMSGYAFRNRVAEGTRIPLWAKALAIQDASGNQGLLLTLDLVGIDRPTSREICNAVMRRSSLNRSQIVISTSHTHTGPVVGTNLRTMYFLSDPEWKAIDRYREFLKQKVISTGLHALQSLKPARLDWAVGASHVAVNRRNNPENLVPERRRMGQLAGPVDYRVPVLWVRGLEGENLAIIFGYACHGTTLNDYRWSGDYPGYAEIELERIFPGVTALFWSGCGADINPLPRRKPELAQRYGRDLASSVRHALAGMVHSISPELTASYREIDLPFDTLPTKEAIEADLRSENRYQASRAAALLQQIKEHGSLSESYPYPICVWGIGNEVRFVSLGGEVVVDFALRFRREFGPATWVASYSHDVMAYIPSHRVWAEGGYEGGDAMVYYGLPARWAPTVEQLIAAEVRRQMDLLTSSRPDLQIAPPRASVLP